MGINGVSSYANTYTYGNVKPSKNSEKNYYAGYTMNSANKFTLTSLGLRVFSTTEYSGDLPAVIADFSGSAAELRKFSVQGIQMQLFHIV